MNAAILTAHQKCNVAVRQRRMKLESEIQQVDAELNELEEKKYALTKKFGTEPYSFVQYLDFVLPYLSRKLAELSGLTCDYEYSGKMAGKATLLLKNAEGLVLHELTLIHLNGEIGYSFDRGNDKFYMERTYLPEATPRLPEDVNEVFALMTSENK